MKFTNNYTSKRLIALLILTALAGIAIAFAADSSSPPSPPPTKVKAEDKLKIRETELGLMGARQQKSQAESQYVQADAAIQRLTNEITQVTEEIKKKYNCQKCSFNRDLDLVPDTAPTPPPAPATPTPTPPAKEQQKK